MKYRCAIISGLAVAAILLVLTMLIFALHRDVRTSPSDLSYGPGPTHYTVQPQPPLGACHYQEAENGEILPDPTCTPGALNPKVTQDTLATTICKPGYTKSIRPSSSITQAEKKANALAYSYQGAAADTEYDHLISPGAGRRS